MEHIWAYVDASPVSGGHFQNPHTWFESILKHLCSFEKNVFPKRVTEESKSSPILVSSQHFDKTAVLAEEVCTYIKVYRANSDSVKAKIALLHGWPNFIGWKFNIRIDQKNLFHSYNNGTYTKVKLVSRNGTFEHKHPEFWCNSGSFKSLFAR